MTTSLIGEGKTAILIVVDRVPSSADQATSERGNLGACNEVSEASMAHPQGTAPTLHGASECHTLLDIRWRSALVLQHSQGKSWRPFSYARAVVGANFCSNLVSARLSRQIDSVCGRWCRSESTRGNRSTELLSGAPSMLLENHSETVSYSIA